jgi:hypothetical protein
MVAPGDINRDCELLQVPQRLAALHRRDFLPSFSEDKCVDKFKPPNGRKKTDGPIDDGL